MGKLWPTLRKIRTERDHFPQFRWNVGTQFIPFVFFGGGGGGGGKVSITIAFLGVWEVC